MTTLAILGMLSWQKAVVILAVVLLAFGRRLPGVARSLGRTIVEFKRGLRDDVPAQPPRLPRQSDL